MEISYLLAPATVLLLCVLEINYGDKLPKTFEKNSGYFSQIQIVSFNDSTENTSEDDALGEIYHITEMLSDINALASKYKYQYVRAFAREEI